MSPTRIGLIELLVLRMRAAVLIADGSKLDVPLGFSGGLPLAMRDDDGQLHLPPGTHALSDADLHFPCLVVNVGDLALGQIAAMSSLGLSRDASGVRNSCVDGAIAFGFARPGRDQSGVPFLAEQARRFRSAPAASTATAETRID